jgi:hypothetical protein
MVETRRALRSLLGLPTLLGLSAVLGALSGCDASITGDASNPGGPGPGTGTGTAGSSSAGSGPGADPNAVGLKPLSRLTRREYNNTVRDLLGDATRPADEFAEDRDRSFLFRRAGLVATQDAELLGAAAETLAAAAIKNTAKVLPCDAASGEDACAQKFIAEFGKKAYRRPLSSAESTRLSALYTDARTAQQMSFNDAIQLLLEAMLQSPAFLYHWESPYDAPKVSGSAVELGQYDVASRLSYFIWGSMPDQALFDAAGAGKLAADADIAAQAQRMLADDKAKEGATAFFREWLEIDQLPQLPKSTVEYPAYNADLKSALIADTDAFTRKIFFEGDGKLETLLAGNFSFGSQPMSTVYGAADPTQRLGLLTQPSFLAMTGAPDGSHPVKRGKAIYEKFLCGELPPPPPNVPPAKPATSGGTTRMRFVEHDQNACAKACHSIMDPIGFAFEHYDGIGRYRTTDNDLPVDSTGSLEIDGVVQPFADAVELTRMLATSSKVRQCVARQWFRFAVGRKDTEADATSLAAVQTAFAAHSFDLRDLAPAIAGSRSFRFRALAAGEKAP